MTAHTTWAVSGQHIRLVIVKPLRLRPLLHLQLNRPLPLMLQDILVGLAQRLAPLLLCAPLGLLRGVIELLRHRQHGR